MTAYSFGIFGAEVSLSIDNRYSFSLTAFSYTIELFGARAIFMAGGAKKVDLSVLLSTLASVGGTLRTAAIAGQKVRKWQQRCTG